MVVESRVSEAQLASLQTMLAITFESEQRAPTHSRTLSMSFKAPCQALVRTVWPCGRSLLSFRPRGATLVVESRVSEAQSPHFSGGARDLVCLRAESSNALADLIDVLQGPLQCACSKCLALRSVVVALQAEALPWLSRVVLVKCSFPLSRRSS